MDTELRRKIVDKAFWIRHKHMTFMHADVMELASDVMSLLGAVAVKCDQCSQLFVARKSGEKRPQRFCKDSCRIDYHNALKMKAYKSKRRVGNRQ